MVPFLRVPCSGITTRVKGGRILPDTKQKQKKKKAKNQQKGANQKKKRGKTLKRMEIRRKREKSERFFSLLTPRDR